MSRSIFARLGEDERREVAGSIEVRLDSEASAVLFSAADAAREARAALEDAEPAALIAIDRGEVRGERTASAPGRGDPRMERRSRARSRMQLPAAMALDHDARRDAAIDAVARGGAQARGHRPRGPAPSRSHRRRQRCRERAYETARTLLEGARAESWRASTHGEILLRIQEIALLDEVLARAASGVEAADGERVTLDFGGVKHPGTIELISSQLMRDGFLLRPLRGDRRVIHVVFLPGGDDERARLLGPRDVLRFAGLSDLEGLPARERVRAGAFLHAEGRSEEASRALPVEMDAELEGLIWNLEGRIEREIGAARAAAAEGPVEGAAAPPPSLPVTLESVYGTPGQRGIGNDVRLVWRFVDERQPPLALRRSLSAVRLRGEDRFGSWRAGGWRRSVDGLVRATTRCETATSSCARASARRCPSSRRWIEGRGCACG